MHYRSAVDDTDQPIVFSIPSIPSGTRTIPCVLLSHDVLEPATRDRFIDVALREGALRRVRPKAMTVVTILAGLLPILFGEGAGAATMSRIAAPMLGGMLSAPLLSMIVLPALYKRLWLWRMQRGEA